MCIVQSASTYMYFDARSNNYAFFYGAEVSTWMVPGTGNRVDKGRGAAAGLVASIRRSSFSVSLIYTAVQYSSLLNLFGLQIT
jgi:hypothetical protein